MKKIVYIFMTLTLLFITGCGNKKIDFSILENNIKNNDNFKDTEVLSLDDINYRYDIDTKDFGNSLIYYSNSLENANTIFVIETLSNDGDKEYDKLVASYKASWLDNPYNLEEAAKVKNAYNETYNGYKIFIVSDNNEGVLKIVKESLK